MAKYRLVDADQLDADMTSVANSIRSVSGKTEQLKWPGDYKTEIEALSGSGVTIILPNMTVTDDGNGNVTIE